jgi:hypothetical protein
LWNCELKRNQFKPAVRTTWAPWGQVKLRLAARPRPEGER